MAARVEDDQESGRKRWAFKQPSKNRPQRLGVGEKENVGEVGEEEVGRPGEALQTGEEEGKFFREDRGFLKPGLEETARLLDIEEDEVEGHPNGNGGRGELLVPGGDGGEADGAGEGPPPQRRPLAAG